jgi:hypothetical protein
VFLHGVFFSSGNTAALVLNNNQNPLVAPDFRLAAGAFERHRFSIKFGRNRMRLVDNSRYGQHAPITL